MEEYYTWFNSRLIDPDSKIDDYTDGMIKQDNIECPICLENFWGVKLPNCEHYICGRCYYKMYNGFLSQTFMEKNQKPTSPKLLKAPEYPYSIKLLGEKKLKEIYDKLSSDETFKSWFINENEELYNAIKLNSVYVEDLEENIKNWFLDNKKLKEHEDNLKNYNIEKKENYDLWSKYYEESRNYYQRENNELNNNRRECCPFCRR